MGGFRTIFCTSLLNLHNTELFLKSDSNNPSNFLGSLQRRQGLWMGGSRVAPGNQRITTFSVAAVPSVKRVMRTTVVPGAGLVTSMPSRVK